MEKEWGLKGHMVNNDENIKVNDKSKEMLPNDVKANNAEVELKNFDNDYYTINKNTGKIIFYEHDYSTKKVPKSDDYGKALNAYNHATNYMDKTIAEDELRDNSIELQSSKIFGNNKGDVMYQKIPIGNTGMYKVKYVNTLLTQEATKTGNREFLHDINKQKDSKAFFRFRDGNRSWDITKFLTKHQALEDTPAYTFPTGEQLFFASEDKLKQFLGKNAKQKPQPVIFINPKELKVEKNLNIEDLEKVNSTIKKQLLDDKKKLKKAIIENDVIIRKKK
jgi:hypothetical protein